jgi:hypothetical protein
VVCQAIGLETGTASADYISLWNGDAAVLLESLELVQRTAAEIITAVVVSREGGDLREQAETANSSR